MVGAFCLCLLFLFVPETIWDRSLPRQTSDENLQRASKLRSLRYGPEEHVPPLTETKENVQQKSNEINPSSGAVADADPLASNSSNKHATGNIDRSLKRDN